VDRDEHSLDSVRKASKLSHLIHHGIEQVLPKIFVIET
jgi:hypothetical protein